MSDNKEISKEAKPAVQQKVVNDGASNSVSEERVVSSGLAALVGDDLLDSDEDDGSFDGEDSASGDDSEKDSEAASDEDSEEASSETEKRATLNNLNDEQLFGLGASTGHNDANESESDSENDDEESEENSTEQPTKKAKKRQADEAGDTDAKKTKQE